VTQINEILTLKDSACIIEGVVLFYKGFHVASTLQGATLRSVIRIANLNDLFERTKSSQEEAILDYVYFSKEEFPEVENFSPDASVLYDEQHMRRKIISEEEKLITGNKKEDRK